ncbi:MAG: phosphatidylinositol-specific phospholipase C [Calothrix sp. C42_A2020_038]|nr:phosphatidylinositol-specific phospholipase C [Calothrix sp. C42_A2020_038]
MLNFKKPFISFVLLPIASVTAFAGNPEIASAHNHPAYVNASNIGYNNPNWMAKIPDNRNLSSLSIPGTHDSMSLHGGDVVTTQSMSLATQLNSGIRVLDIRCRHINDSFAIHHGVVYQKANFDDVLKTVADFLANNPSETVLMRVKEEYKPQNNTRSFEETFKKYNEKYSKFIWAPTSQNPKLGDVRGKIVILQDFSASSQFGLQYNRFDSQDNYNLKTNWDLHQKWTYVKAHINKANASNKDKFFINYLSGSGGSFPYFVASGHSSPGTSAPRLSTGATTPAFKNKYPDFPRVNCRIGICTIAFEGTNVLTYEKIKNKQMYTGIIMADFPGGGLIDSVIKLNN